jgi:type I restriction enzyme M protein
MQVQEVRQRYKVSVQKLKEAQKAQQKSSRPKIKVLDRQIPQAETALKLLSNRGKLQLLLADDDLIGTLKERWIAAEVAKQLDYPIFMAVSERGGKDNSGDYKYLLDEQGSLVEFPDGHPQEGQIVIDQDLVNYDLRAADLADAAKDSLTFSCVWQRLSFALLRSRSLVSGGGK